MMMPSRPAIRCSSTFRFTPTAAEVPAASTLPAECALGHLHLNGAVLPFLWRRLNSTFDHPSCIWPHANPALNGRTSRKDADKHAG